MFEIKITARAAKKIRSGYPWVYSNDVLNGRELPPVCTGCLTDPKERKVGLGVFNRHSLIQARLLTHEADADIPVLIRHKISLAAVTRERLYPGESALRLFFAESDGLPGLIIDRYGDIFILEINSKGMFQYEDEIVKALTELFSPRCIILKNSSTSLKPEGLDPETRLLHGSCDDEVVFEEQGILFSMEPLSGQKTGFFFDQKDNRRVFSRLAPGRSVTDLFSYSGAWGLYALKGGADHAVFVDSSEDACRQVRRNAALNGFSNIEVIKGDVFEYLYSGARLNPLVTLDPPAYAKTGRDVKKASSAYTHLNRMLFKKLPAGGFAATSSCSYHISEELFDNILYKAAYESKMRIYSHFNGNQAADHPVPLNFPESRYLKTRFVRKAD